MDRIWMRPSSTNLVPAWEDPWWDSAIGGFLSSGKQWWKNLRTSWCLWTRHWVKDLFLTLVCVTVLLLLFCHPQPHRGAEAAGHVGPTVLPYKGQVEGSDVPGRGTEMARSKLGIPLPAPRRQFALPEQTNTFPPGSTVLSGARGHPSWRWSPKEYWKGQQVKRFYIHVGFDNL